MNKRYQEELAYRNTFMPAATEYVERSGNHVWIFPKRTEVGIDFKIAIYYSHDEGGYCSQLVSPEIENAWRDPHVGHIFKDGVICLGGASMRSRLHMADAYAKSCVWAEGIAVMIASKAIGSPTSFPFSFNNSDEEVS
jgi:hypothetical protein